MKLSNKLTELAIKNAKPSEKVRKLSDGGGMYLLVHPNGSKYWRMDFRFNGKQKTVALGIWPTDSLSIAREKREQAKKLIKQGINPVDDRKEKKRQKEQKEDNDEKETYTFEFVALDWMKRQNPTWTVKHANDIKRGLEIHIFPYIGDRLINELGTRDVLEVLRKIEKQGKYEAAFRARQRCEAIFRYGIITGICQKNPASDLRGALTPPKKEKQASITPSELPDFLQKLDLYDGYPITKLAMRFVIYTFVRTSELRLAEWEEMNMSHEKPVWKIPAERMKNRRELIVPLVPQTLNLLKNAKEISAEGKFVFPGQNNHNRPMSENTLLYALYRMGYHSRATVHGFRSTASTILNESGLWSPDVIERQLSHVEANKIRAAYNYAEHLDERRRMMTWWADYLDKLLS